MKKVSKIALLLLLSLGILHLPIYSQSRENGAIQGRVTTDTGEFLPGTEVKLSSPNLIGGNQFAITDGSGKFRFVALPPGTYSVTATLAGFTPARQENLRLHAQVTLTVTLVLAVGAISEEVVVVAEAPMVDVKDSASATADLPIEFLQMIPNNQALHDAIEMAPGVTDRIAFGGIQRGASNNYQVDGANFDDPGDGAGYRLEAVDYNTIQEAKMSGVGANAEYDGFTGAVFSVITKSGGNKLSGDINFLYSDNSWDSDNTGDTGFGSAAQQSFYDVSGHLGGPLIKDKLWFFVGAKYYYSQRAVAGFEFDSISTSPLLFGKLTWQAGKNDRFRAFINWRTIRGTYSGGGFKVAVEATTTANQYMDSTNLNWLHVFSDTTFIESKYSRWTVDDRQVPISNDLPGREDFVTQWKTENSTGWWQGHVWNHNVNVAVSHHAADFLGAHDFKFGTDFYAGGAHDQAARPGGKWYLDYDKEPWFRYDYVGLEGIEDFPLGYNLEPRNIVLGAYVQDSWSVTDRLTINYGLRLNSWKNSFESRMAEQYKATGLSPRIGFSYDVFGDHSTAIKAHYGRYYDKLNFVALYALPTQNADMITYSWNTGTEEWDYENTYWGSLPDGTTPTDMDQDIKHPSMDQFSLGITRELAKDLSLELTYIYRNSNDILDVVNLNATWETVVVTDPFTEATYEVYSQTNEPDDNRYLITNPKAGQTDSVITTPTRKYNAVMVVLEKRFSNNWQLRTSYVYSSLSGTYDNTYDRGIALYSSFYQDPNYQTNADGKCTFSPTHVFKLQGLVNVPIVDISIGVNLALISGNNYTRTLFIEGLGQGSINLFTEPKGSRRTPSKTNLDIRVEKVFYIEGGSKRFGLTVDIFNALNKGTVHATEDSIGLVTDAGPAFEEISNILDPRSFRIGFRFSF